MSQREFNYRRTARLIDEAIDAFDLDLTELSIYTEAATGGFAATAAIAVAAGAETVYALAEGSRYGSAAEAQAHIKQLAKHVGDEQNMVFPERAATIRENYDVTVRNNVDELEHARAVTVAVPNQYYRPVATSLAERGIDILIEKPIAMTVENATAIVETAAANDVVLQAGHIERFNPAVQVIDEILNGQEIIALEAHRLGSFNEHLIDESVIFDLMIHDIDVIWVIVDTPVEHTDAVGARSHPTELDHAVAHLKFEGGVLGTMTSSHVIHSKIRTLTATTRETFNRTRLPTTADYGKQAWNRGDYAVRGHVELSNRDDLGDTVRSDP